MRLAELELIVSQIYTGRLYTRKTILSLITQFQHQAAFFGSFMLR